MKKFYFLFIITGYLNLQAQKISEIFITQNGLSATVNVVTNNLSFSVNTEGAISGMSFISTEKILLENNARTTFYKDIDLDYRDPNSTLSKEGNIEYYDNFYEYKSGKIKSIGDLKFDYYDGFYPYQKGKISSIGDVKFTYYDTFYSYQKGKIQSIGNITFTYFDDFYNYKKGKLKSIKGNNSNIKITLIND